MVEIAGKISKAVENVSYEQWLINHGAKHEKIINLLQAKQYSKKQIVEYFDYENMRLEHPEFCILYAKNQKCHDTKDLNCFFCGCPHFRFFTRPKDNLHSYCSIDSKDGEQICYETGIHQDCTYCTIPHKTSYVLQFYTHKWNEKMSLCKIET